LAAPRAGAALAGPALLDRAFAASGGSTNSSPYFYFAVIADTHIIDEFYKGPESTPLDTESIFKTTERLVSARTLINGLHPPMERVFLVGDYFHNYPSQDWDFYFKNQTRVDRCKELTDAFKMPVHENAYMLVEANTVKQTHRFLNLDSVDWATHYSKPYKA
jgi:hypothetical protein